MSEFQLYTQPTLFDIMAICHRLPQDEREQIEAFTGEPYSADDVAVAHWCKPGPKWLLMKGDQQIAIAGFDQIRPGVWQDWMLNTPEAFDIHWRTVTKNVRKVMDAMLKHNAHRLQCVSLASRIHAHKWYRVLGLQLEGTLHAYGANGEDALMFYRLRAENG